MNDSFNPRVMPYPGLRPFEESDHNIFFGRELQVIDMLKFLEFNRFVAVVGSSGSGKSSLVRAGLLPAVRRGFLCQTKDWIIVPPTRPGNDPYGRLAKALASCVFGSEESVPKEKERLIATLRETDRGLLDVLDESRLNPAKKVLIVIDQFEELFTFRLPDRTAEGGVLREDASAFVRMLLRSKSDENGRVFVVLTMRSDWIGHCEAFLGLAEQVSRCQFLVPRLNRSEMEEAICRPGEAKDAGFHPFTVSRALMNQVINDAGDRPDQLPLMQHALMRTWKRAAEREASEDGPRQITIDDYTHPDVGGVENALSRHAEDAWMEIEKDTRKSVWARQLFLLLCEIGPNGHIIRRRPRMSEVIAVTGATLPQLTEIISIFQADDRNFIFPPARELTPDTQLDISHEALLRQWGTYKKWQTEERYDAADFQYWGRQAAENAKLHQSEQTFLDENALKRAEEWRKRTSEEWARRYADKESASYWNLIQGLISESRKILDREAWQRRNRTISSSILLSVAIISAIVCGLSLYVLKQARHETAAAQEEMRAAQESRSTALKAVVEAGEKVTNAMKMADEEHAKALEAKKQVYEANEFVAKAKAEAMRVTENASNEVANANKEKKMAIDAIEEKSNAEHHKLIDFQARLIAGAIGNSTSLIPSYNEQENLWQLAETPEDEVRSNVLAIWLQYDDPLKRLSARDGQGMRAVFGLDLKRQQWLMQQSGTVLPRLKTSDEFLYVSSTDANTFASFLAPRSASQVCSEIVASAIPARLADAANLVEALAARADDEQTLKAIANKAFDILGSSNQLSVRQIVGLDKIIARLVVKTNLITMATRGMEVLSTALTNLDVEDDLYIDLPTNMLYVLAAKMDAHSASTMSTQLMEALLLNSSDDSSRLQHVTEVLDAVSTRLESDMAGSLAERSLGAIRNQQDASGVYTNADRAALLTEFLGSLISRVDSTNATALANKSLGIVVSLLTNAPGTNSIFEFPTESAFSKLLTRTAPDEITFQASRLIAELETSTETNSVWLSKIGKCLSAMTRATDSTGGIVLAGRLQKAMERADPLRLMMLGNALAALPRGLESNGAANFILLGAKSVERAMETFETTNDSVFSISYGLQLAFQALTARLDTNTATGLAKDIGLDKKLLNGSEKNSDRMWNFMYMLTALSTNMDEHFKISLTASFTSFLQRSATADENSLLSLRRRLSTILITQLSRNMTTNDAATQAENLTASVEGVRAPAFNWLSAMGQALVPILARMDTNAAVPVATRAAVVFNNALFKLEEKELDFDHFRNWEVMANCFKTFAEHGDAKTNSLLAPKIVQALELALTNRQDSLQYTSRLSSLGTMLASLAMRMDADAAAVVKVRGAIAIGNCLTNSGGGGRVVSDVKLGRLLGTYSLSLPNAERTRKFSLAFLLLELGSRESRYYVNGRDDARLAADLCRTFDANVLTSILKWPFCVGDAQRIVLHELGKKTQRDFNGDVWNFVAQADSLGIQKLSTPPDFPQIDDVLKELEGIRKQLPLTALNAVPQNN